jgi:hypothetical protein
VSDPGPSVPAMVIDCDTCQVAGPACQDCVVSVLLGVPEVRASREPQQAARDAHAEVAAVVELDDEHARALEVLAQGGMVPPLRLRRSVG